MHFGNVADSYGESADWSKAYTVQKIWRNYEFIRKVLAGRCLYNTAENGR